MPTIRDVAKLAGVSRSTVSLVLNGSPRVKEETRQIVKEVIQRIDYVPNNSARSLNSRTMNSLGIIVMIEHEAYGRYDAASVTSLFSHDVTTGISRELADTDYSVVIEQFCFEENSGELPKIIKARRVDGAFIVGGFYNDKFIDKLIEKKIPIVIVGGKKEKLVDSVIPDPEKGVYLASKHLLETGHKRICLVNSPPVYRSSYQRISGMERSLQGYEHTATLSMATCEHNTAESGYVAIKGMWSDSVAPDGIIAANAPIASGILHFLFEKGLRVPEDVSLITHEDSILSGHAVPALTAINTQKEYMGEMAARLLLKRLRNPQKEVESLISEPFFVSRDSVKTRY